MPAAFCGQEYFPEKWKGPCSNPSNSLSNWFKKLILQNADLDEPPHNSGNQPDCYPPFSTSRVPGRSALKYAPLWSVWVNGTRKARNLQKNIVLLPFFRYVYYVYAFYLRLSRWISTDIFGSMTFTHLSIYLIHNLKSNLYARLIAFSCKNLSFLIGKHLLAVNFCQP